MTKYVTEGQALTGVSAQNHLPHRFKQGQAVVRIGYRQFELRSASFLFCKHRDTTDIIIRRSRSSGKACLNTSLMAACFLSALMLIISYPVCLFVSLSVSLFVCVRTYVRAYTHTHTHTHTYIQVGDLLVFTKYTFTPPSY